MADPRFSQNAARLSEDIGDVLTAIRRMIADDDALSSARDSIQAERNGLVQDDAGEFLARRYGQCRPGTANGRNGSPAGSGGGCP